MKNLLKKLSDVAIEYSNLANSIKKNIEETYIKDENNVELQRLFKKMSPMNEELAGILECVDKILGE